MNVCYCRTKDVLIFYKQRKTYHGCIKKRQHQYYGLQ